MLKVINAFLRFFPRGMNTKQAYSISDGVQTRFSINQINFISNIKISWFSFFSLWYIFITFTYRIVIIDHLQQYTVYEKWLWRTKIHFCDPRSESWFKCQDIDFDGKENPTCNNRTRPIFINITNHQKAK